MNVKSIAASCLIATVTAIQLQEELVATHEGEEGHAAGRPWTNNSVNWCRASNADDHRINAVLRGIEQYGEALPGCIKFTEVPESNGACVTPDAPAIHIKTDQNAGCWSYMGMIRGPGQSQDLNIGQGCTSMGTVLHEIAHALGQAHEQSRSDRDDNVFIDMSNIPSNRHGNFRKSAKSYVKMPYDYSSIMQYGAWGFAIDSSKPVITPINCEPNCPPLSALGARTGFTLLDQRQAADMYHCTTKQMAIRTEETECIDWKELPQNTNLDCAAYKAAGKCTADSRPCCNCNKWGSGIKARKWVMSKAPADCKNIQGSEVCKRMKAAGMCWSNFVKQNCENTCETCTKGPAQNYADVMTGRDVVSMPGGKNFVGEVDAAKKPNGQGVLTWGNLVRHIGYFVNGQPKADAPMARMGTDGSVFYGKVVDWLNVEGSYVPPVAVSKDVAFKGTYSTTGELNAGGMAEWDNGKMTLKGVTFTNGLANGAGDFRWTADAATSQTNLYQGNFVDGKPSGAGKVTFSTGETFEATWTAGNGVGKFCKNEGTIEKCGDWTFRLF